MASQVPYSGAPEIAPQGGALPQVHVDAPGAAFGTTVAAAVQHVGEVVEGAGKELFQRAYGFQEMDQQIKADAAAADYMDAATQRYLEFDQLKGQERVAGMRQYTQDLQTMREKAGADLESPYARQRFLQESRQTQSRMMWHGGVLARQGQDEAAHAAAQGKMDATVQNFTKVDPSDPQEFDKNVGIIRQSAADLVHQKTGFGPDTEEGKNAAAPIISGQVSKMLVAKSNSDPVAAKKLYEQSKAKGLLTPEDADRLEQRIELAVTNKLGRREGTKIGADSSLRHEPPSVVAKQARDRAEQLDPGNKDLATTMEDAAVSRQSQEKNLEAASWREQQKILLDGINGTNSPDGKVPTSLEQALEDPVWRERYNSLPKSEQSAIEEQIRRNQSTNGYVPNPKGTAEFLELNQKLRAPNSPEELDEALNVNLTKTHMILPHVKSIMNLQAEVLKAQGSPSAINRDLQTPEVQAAIETAGLSRNSAEYRAFVHQFTEAVQGYTEGGKKVIRGKELGEIASNMLMKQAGRHWWSFSSDPFYKDPYSNPKVKNIARKEWMDMHPGEEPTDEQLQTLATKLYRDYFRELGAKSRPEPGKDTARAPNSTRPKPAETENPLPVGGPK